MKIRFSIFWQLSHKLQHYLEWLESICCLPRKWQNRKIDVILLIHIQSSQQWIIYSSLGSFVNDTVLITTWLHVFSYCCWCGFPTNQFRESEREVQKTKYKKLENKQRKLKKTVFSLLNSKFGVSLCYNFAPLSDKLQSFCKRKCISSKTIKELSCMFHYVRS